MITKMIRGKQEDTVGAVENIQVVQEEEEMKTENIEGTENMEGSKSNENMSCGASVASTQKRTNTKSNNAHFHPQQVEHQQY
jgi:hypothetical protein